MEQHLALLKEEKLEVSALQLKNEMLQKD